MQSSLRAFESCGTTLTQRRASVVTLLRKPCSPSTPRHLGDQLLVPERRQHARLLSTFVTLAASDANSSSATATRPHENDAGKDFCSPLPAHADDILLVPAAHHHLVQLERQGIYTLADFRRAYERERASFRRFLQDEIGVLDEGRVVAMEAFFRAMVGQRATAAPPATAAPAAAPIAALGTTSEQVTLSVEGNISAGKSTFLSILNRHLFTDQGYIFVKEPIEQWQRVGGSSVNLLDLFYRDPARMAYTFQNFVFLTRVLQERETYGNTTKARILERSIFSDRMVFVRAVHASSDLADHELAIYDAWFGPILASLPTLVPNGLIYLRASPETCMARLRKRARSEEGGIPLDYLQCLYRNHEDWLVQASAPASELRQRLLRQQQQREQEQDLEEVATAERQRSSSQASTSTSISKSCLSSSSSAADPVRLQRERQRLPPLKALRPLEESPPAALGLVELPEPLADCLRILDATKISGVPSAGFLHHMPALVVDCNADVDVDGDVGYSERMSELIRDYIAFVSAYRAACHRLAGDSSRSAEAEAAGTRSLPYSATDYYTTDGAGRVTYRPVVPDVPGGVAMGAATASGAAAAAT